VAAAAKAALGELHEEAAAAAAATAAAEVAA